MKTILSVIAFVLYLGVAISGFAGEISFRCTMQHEYHFAADGQLERRDEIHYKHHVIEVERSTGRITGDALSIEPGPNVKVVDSGEDGSFKLFYSNSNKKWADSLTIKTRQKENGKMPFIFIDYLQTIVTGVCD